jgi:hypothetical protein
MELECDQRRETWARDLERSNVWLSGLTTLPRRSDLIAGHADA